MGCGVFLLVDADVGLSADEGGGEAGWEEDGYVAVWGDCRPFDSVFSDLMRNEEESLEGGLTAQ